MFSMRIIVALILTVLFIGRPSAAQTRAQDDSVNAVRRCEIQRRSDELADQYAIRCAEHFIAAQGYTTSPPTSDTSRVVAEGIEWAPSKAEWLAYRRGTLDSHAAGICIGPDSGRYTVVFRDPGHGHSRGVTLDATFGSLRVQHQDLRFDVVNKREYGCRPIPVRPPQ